MKHWFWLSAVFTLVLITVAACGKDDNTSDPAPTDTPAPTATSQATAMPSEERQRLERQYSTLNAAYTELSSLWEGLASGQQIQCAAPPEFPAPEEIAVSDSADGSSVNDYLRSAAIELEQASRLWITECANPRTTIPPDIIDQGRLATRAAGDALRQVETLLAAP